MREGSPLRTLGRLGAITARGRGQGHPAGLRKGTTAFPTSSNAPRPVAGRRGQELQDCEGLVGDVA